MSQCFCSFINGMKAQHTPLKEARIVFYGAGSSAVGVATMIAQLISKETGIPFDEAKKVPGSVRETLILPPCKAERSAHAWNLLNSGRSFLCNSP